MSNKDKIIERLEDTIKKGNIEIEWWKRQNEMLQDDLFRSDLKVQSLEKLRLENLKARLRTAVEGLLTIKESHAPMHISEKPLEEILPKND